jgi:hypothetical protein
MSDRRNATIKVTEKEIEAIDEKPIALVFLDTKRPEKARRIENRESNTCDHVLFIRKIENSVNESR